MLYKKIYIYAEHFLNLFPLSKSSVCYNAMVTPSCKMSHKSHPMQFSWKRAGHRPCNSHIDPGIARQTPYKCHEIATSHMISQELSQMALTERASAESVTTAYE